MEKSKIIQRIDNLVEEIRNIFDRLSKPDVPPNTATAEQYQEWLLSTKTILKLLPLEGNHYLKEYDAIRSDETDPRFHFKFDIEKLRRIIALLSSLKKDIELGLLVNIEYLYVAETFDDFLDHAEKFHKANEVIQSSVLASVVLEDTVKKIAIKNNVDSKQTLEPLIDDLVKADVFLKTKAKRIKAYAGTRTHALHAEWDDIEITAVGEMISGIRELIEHYIQ